MFKMLQFLKPLRRSRASAVHFVAAMAFTAALTLPATAVPVQINSGDPAFPFPQFLPYAHPSGDTLHTLASRQFASAASAKTASAGVTHAEMEKTIRDAYQIMMNRAEYTTLNGLTGVGGVRYIKFNSNPVCSEGDGYALLAAAMMADKTTFDGLWLHTHDGSMNNTVRYGDGVRNSPDYTYAPLPGWTNNAGANSAADGDFDIALALMIAHRQWGDLMGINDSRGNPISYKNDFINFIKAMTDTLTNKETLPERELLTGNIGFDGYFRGGNTWGEMTQWAASAQNLTSIGVLNTSRVYQPSGVAQHIDYTAQAYFRQFADYLRTENAAQYAWNISQYERAEVSSDWLFGKHHEQNQRNIPFAGWVEFLGDTTVRFTNFNEGEDFRAPWRTVLSYVWHGNPSSSWDPVRHVVIRNRSNTHMRDAGNRLARFLWDRRQAPWSQECETIIGEGLWWGPSMLKYFYTPQGAEPNTFTLNWLQGTGSPSAVTSQDYNLMAEMYRQAELEWDAATGGYLESVPQYFHGFFRLLGLNIMTGNHHAPLNMKRAANMKVYMDVDKTYAFENDTITYTIDYRNYGAADAQNVAIANRLHNDFVFVSASGGGTFDISTRSVRWSIPSVPGFKTSTGVAPTRGTVSFKVVIPFANLKRYENKAVITCSNGSGWESDEYPNKISSVMKRTGVDLARRALRVDKSVYRDTVNPGMNAIYTIFFENSAEAGWMNGGRPGVNFSYGHKGTPEQATDHTFMIRGFNDAHEAYIDYGNYRVSYFMFDNSITSLGDNGWRAPADIVIPTSLTAGVASGLRHEMITPGQDTKGRWNQRLILQLANPESPTRSDTNWATMAAPTQYLLNYYGMGSDDGTGGLRIHRGVDSPLKIVWRMHTGTYANRAWGNDWSYDSRPVVSTGSDDMPNWGYPISPDFTENPDPDYQGRPVAARHRKLCEPASSVIVDNILIEEWDGYTWRRVFGNGPLPGREVNNVRIIDTIPVGVTYQRFLDPLPFGITPDTARASNGQLVITWNIPKLLVGEKGSINYTVRADALPAGVTSSRIASRAWAIADRESPLSSTAVLVVTTDSLPPPPPEPTTMYKSTNKDIYRAGDTITYTIAYKQTHGYPVRSASRSEWTGTGTDKVNSTGDEIAFNVNWNDNTSTNIYHSLTYGTNGALTGSASPLPDGRGNIQIFGRYDPSGNNSRVEVTFRRDWAGLYVSLTANGQGPIEIASPFSLGTDGSFDYRLVFKNDSLLMWIGDTSAAIPAHVFTNIPIQAGYAGVRYTSNEGGAWLRNWASHFDLAYNVIIRDTIPPGVVYVPNSATGAINTGDHAPRTLPGTYAGGVITWPVVSGMTPANALGGNDSLTVTWRGAVDSASVRNNMIVNIAYADLAGYPRDSLGALVRSSFTTAPPYIPPTDTNPPLLAGLTVSATPSVPLPESFYFNEFVRVTLAASLPGASIYYTTDQSTPDSTKIPYSGQPIELRVSTLLSAIAYLPGYNPAPMIQHMYDPAAASTVGVSAAILFDDVGNGCAQGLKIAVIKDVQLPNLETIRQNISLISIPGLQAVFHPDSVRLVGDTIIIRFANVGGIAYKDIPTSPRLVINAPSQPTQGFLAAVGGLSVTDGVAPVIERAVYKPIMTTGGISGDTLVVTFNKPATVVSTDPATPLRFRYKTESGWEEYELEIRYVKPAGNALYFVISGISGRPDDTPAEGDSVSIKPDGQVRNLAGYGQYHENNPAVKLEVLVDGLKHVLKAGPSPSTENIDIRITVDPFLRSALEKMDPKVRIYDIMGRVVAQTGKNLTLLTAESEYQIRWDGSNMAGRLVGTGTYLIQVTAKGQEGNKITLTQRVYILRDKRK